MNVIVRSTIVTLFLVMTTSLSLGDIYELRTYTPNPGKLENLNARFRDHTVKLFKKHGMESVGYWVATDGDAKNSLIYAIAHESREKAAASWKAFRADPVWQKVAKESEKDGKILAKKPDSVFIELTKYSPTWKNEKGDDDDVYELRIYKAAKAKLELLDARFRDHTIKLFEKHGIKNVAYWHPADEPDSQDTLIYIIKHESREAAAKSWKAFREDPAWKKAAAESGVGKLAKRPESIYMKPTDYSPIR